MQSFCGLLLSMTDVLKKEPGRHRCVQRRLHVDIWRKWSSTSQREVSERKQLWFHLDSGLLASSHKKINFCGLSHSLWHFAMAALATQHTSVLLFHYVPRLMPISDGWGCLLHTLFQVSHSTCWKCFSTFSRCSNVELLLWLWISFWHNQWTYVLFLDE